MDQLLTMIDDGDLEGLKRMIQDLERDGHSLSDILTQRDEDGLTLCFVACREGQLRIVDLLVELGASLNEKDSL